MKLPMQDIDIKLNAKFKSQILERKTNKDKNGIAFYHELLKFNILHKNRK